MDEMMKNQIKKERDKEIIEWLEREIKTAKRMVNRCLLSKEKYYWIARATEAEVTINFIKGEIE